MALALIAGYFVVQLVVGLITDSLALLSDAGHMATDALGLGMALASITVANRDGSSRKSTYRTFGLYRLEILAALANSVLLLAVAVYVVIEAISRFGDAPELNATPVLITGVLGLAVNIAAFLLLRSGAGESLNVRGAYLEVVADMLGSVAVVAAAIIIALTGADWVDPALGVAIGVVIVPRAVRLGRDASRILIQAAPAGIVMADVERDLRSIAGVIDVHDLHIWTLTSDMDVATAHIMVAVGADHHDVLDAARDLLSSRHGLTHATLQVEPEDHSGCDEVDW
ncbi:MAG: cation diffusion facilitator family transporter [Acidimicrobiia bacterium]